MSPNNIQKMMLFHQQQQLDENMSNLTSASGEASGSSGGNRPEIATANFPQQYFTPSSLQQQQQQQQPQTSQQQTPKKKRNLPGNPDPDAEVIALSPKALLATNRFICEICNKGFQRDQNLQLHRRGHNLPWKLKQRSSKEVRKKVYVCPEAGCVHHDPARALGDLTGIKKHFCRKHGEKKWKCDKCSKRYAVQSDWKAHSKTCGTREYRCDCGTLFSRRDSFITHRAFCDALAEESARAIANPPPPPPPPPSMATALSHQFNINDFQQQTQLLNSNNNINNPQLDHNPTLHSFSLKKEQNSFTNLRPQLPPWLGPPIPQIDHHHHEQHHLSSSSSSPSLFSNVQDFTQTAADHHHHGLAPPNPNPSHHQLPPFQPPPSSASAHMSATALLQKAAQMGAAISSTTAANKTASATATLSRPHVQAPADGHDHQPRDLNLSSSSVSRDHQHHHHHDQTASNALQAMMMSSLHSPANNENNINAFGHGVFSHSKKLHDTHSNNILSRSSNTDDQGTTTGGSGVGGDQGLTRDFLGLRPLSHSDILSLAGLGNTINNNNQPQKPW